MMPDPQAMENLELSVTSPGFSNLWGTSPLSPFSPLSPRTVGLQKYWTRNVHT
jgi:hypothetical protein